MPPRVAPTQLVAIPITAAAMPADAREKLAATVAGIMRALKERGVRAALDDRDNYRPGWKYNHWEVKVCTPMHAAPGAPGETPSQQGPVVGMLCRALSPCLCRPLHCRGTNAWGTSTQLLRQ